MIEVVFALLAIQGAIGAFDTFYFHEWKARLPAGGAQTAPELHLHAWRSFLYAAIFGTLPWLLWHGWWVALLAAILIAEIVFTMWDFVVEIAVRKPLGDVYGGERITHALMGIVYGGMLAFLIPILWGWWQQPTALVTRPLDALSPLDWLLLVMALGVFLSGARDLYAALGLPGGGWPWPPLSVDAPR
ncbi:MAG: hypothetical protein U0893_08685 [Chloroflexota bacterium]